jgi:hypothetical protein
MLTKYFLASIDRLKLCSSDLYHLSGGQGFFRVKFQDLDSLENKLDNYKSN